MRALVRTVQAKPTRASIARVWIGIAMAPSADPEVPMPKAVMRRLRNQWPIQEMDGTKRPVRASARHACCGRMSAQPIAIPSPKPCASRACQYWVAKEVAMKQAVKRTLPKRMV